MIYIKKALLLFVIFLLLENICFAAVAITVTPAPVTVIPGSVRTLYATVTGTSNSGVDWAVTSGACLLASGTGPYIKFTAPATPGATCTIRAMTQDAAHRTATVNVTVKSPAVTVSVLPFHITLYRGQYALLQSMVVGSVNTEVTWTKSGGNFVGSAADGAIGFYSDSAGTYTVTATSSADNSKSFAATIVVTDNIMPTFASAQKTEPVDCTATGSGIVYEVGVSGSDTETTKYMAAISAVPWESLSSGDTVRIHPGTYHEQFGITTSGTASQPIRVCGVRDASGNLPVISGVDATTRSELGSAMWGSGIYGLQPYAIVMIHKPGYSYTASYPKNVIVEGLNIRDAGSMYKQIRWESAGAKTSWPNYASCVRIQDGSDILLRGNAYIGCEGWGVMTSAQVPESRMVRRILLQGGYFSENGTVGNYSHHHAYMQNAGLVVQFNYFDHARSGMIGSALKTRSSQIIIRNNFIICEQRCLDLVEVQDPAPYFLSAAYAAKDAADPISIDCVAAVEETFYKVLVYGNVFSNSGSVSESASSPVHYGWDMNEAYAQGGTLFFYNNSWLDEHAYPGSYYSISLFDDGKNDVALSRPQYTYVEAFNNAFYRKGASLNPPYWFWGTKMPTRVNLGINWIDSSWGSSATNGGFGTGMCNGLALTSYMTGNIQCHITGTVNLLTGATTIIPFDSNTYSPQSGSPLIGAAQPLIGAVQSNPVLFQYAPLSQSISVKKSLTTLGAIDYDDTAPVIMQFIAPVLSGSLTAPISSFLVFDNVGVTGYLITETATPPTANDPRWSPAPPSFYTFSSATVGEKKTIYAWAKDALGNISETKQQSVTIDITKTVICK